MEDLKLNYAILFTPNTTTAMGRVGTAQAPNNADKLHPSSVHGRVVYNAKSVAKRVMHICPSERQASARVVVMDVSDEWRD